MNGKGMVFFGVGFELIALCVGGWVLGGYIDQYMGWVNTGATYLTLILMIGWFVHLIHLLKHFEEEDGSDPPN